MKLLVVQPTSLCNLNCKYCYVPDRRNSAVMSDETLNILFEKVFRSSLVESEIEVLWHAGEPLAAGLRFFRNAVALIERHRPSTICVYHTLQTNGTLITREWAEFLRDHRFGVGISIDGPPYLHNLSRVNWAGNGTYSAAIRGFEMLRAVGLEPGILTVLTADSLLKPDDLFHFYRGMKTKWVGFNVEEVENAHTVSSLASVPKEEMALRYRVFIDRFFDLWKQSGRPFAVREFEDILNIIRCVQEQDFYVRIPDETLGLEIITVQRNGDISTFSPEFAGGRCESLNNFVIGNIHDCEFDDLGNSPHYKAIQEKVIAGIRQCASECQWFAFCGGGYTSNKFFENGRLDSTQTTACRLHRQMLAEVLISKLRQPSAVEARV